MSASKEKLPQKPFPRWLIVLAVLVTGGTTVWAMSTTNLRGPRTSWNQAQTAVNQVWADPAASMATSPVAQPGAAWANAPGAEVSQNAARQVAGLPGVPTILYGSQRPHNDRGPCTNCHNVVTADGQPTPVIYSFSSMPHGFRGVCNNCHQIAIGRGFTGLAVAATLMAPETEGGQQPAIQPMLAQQAIQQPMAQPMMAQPMAQAMPQAVTPQPIAQQPMMAQPMMAQPMMQQQIAPQAMPAIRPPPNEADWRGMEVRVGAQGLVVTNAEGLAARSGLQPGDFVTSINGAGVRDVPTFMDATQNGSLRQGTVVVQRAGQRLAFELQPRPNNAVPMAGPTMTGQVPN